MFVGIGLVAGFLLAEIVLRTFPPSFIRVRQGRLLLPANIEYRTQVRAGGGSTTVRHRKNSLGFRGPEKPPNFEQRLSIIAVGGSTTECFYLGDEKSWPERLPVYLAGTVGPVWVNNAGLDGHSTRGHSVLMQDYLIDIGPKVVIFLVGINDAGSEGLRASERQHILTAGDSTSLRGFVRGLARYSLVVDLCISLRRVWNARRIGLGHGLSGITAEEPDDFSVPASTLEKAWQRHVRGSLAFRMRLEKLIEQTLGGGIDPVLATQPALYGSP